MSRFSKLRSLTSLIKYITENEGHPIDLIVAYMKDDFDKQLGQHEDKEAFLEDEYRTYGND